MILYKPYARGPPGEGVNDLYTIDRRVRRGTLVDEDEEKADQEPERRRRASEGDHEAAVVGGSRRKKKRRPRESSIEMTPIEACRYTQSLEIARSKPHVEPEKVTTCEEPPSPPVGRLLRLRRVLLRHLKFIGPGLISSVAYFDPGNWTVDLQAGSNFGYKLLVVVLLASLGAVVLQVLALRLGAVTGHSLAKHCRLKAISWTESHPRVAPYRWRRRATWAGLYTLYALCELAVISTDLAELIGSAIALNLIFPALPLWAGVLITVSDVLLILAFLQRPQDGRRGMLLFELLLIALVLTVFTSFVVLIVRARPAWPQVLLGYVPSATVFGPSALYTAVGIIGATVMPHALFLGSQLGAIDRLAPSKAEGKTESQGGGWRQRLARSIGRRTAPAPLDVVPPSTSSRLASIRIHLAHATFDIICSLVGFAFTINSAILIVAAAVFYYISDSSVTEQAQNADLFAAHALIGQQIGASAAFIFALALLCSGQSASITATLAGQIISDDFIAWRTNPIYRRLITRLIGAVPSAIVAAAVGKSGLNTMLVASQVVLSIILPFAIFPLVWLCHQQGTMTVTEAPPAPTGGVVASASFRAHWSWISAGYLIFALVTVANAYVLVELMLGNG